MDKRFEEMNQNMDTRFKDMRGDMDKRFNQMITFMSTGFVILGFIVKISHV